jgi:hypothetical protein
MRKLYRFIVSALKKMDMQSEKKWVFRARLVVCGYSQVQGIDFDESFALILNGVSFRNMPIVKLD